MAETLKKPMRGMRRGGYQWDGVGDPNLESSWVPVTDTKIGQARFDDRYGEVTEENFRGVPMRKVPASAKLAMREQLAPLENPRNLDKALLEQQVLIENNPIAGKTAPEKFLSGMKNALADQFVYGPKQFGALIGEKLGAMPAGSYDAETQAVEDRRLAQSPLMADPAGRVGYIGGSVAGGVLPARLLKAGTLPQKLLAPRTVLQAPASGAMLGATLPVGKEDSRLENTVMGAGFQTAGVAGGNALARLIRPVPSKSEGAIALLKEGIVPTPGQAVRQNAVGRFLSGMEEKAQSIPLIGDVISSARERSVREVRKAGLKRAGFDGDDIGPDSYAAAHKTLGKTFNKISMGPPIPIPQDWADKTYVSALSKPDISLSPEGEQTVASIIEKVEARIANGQLLGAEYAAARTSLGNAVRQFSSSTDPYQRALGKSIEHVQNSLDDALEKARPDLVDEIQTVRQQYRNLRTLEDAAARATDGESGYSVAQLRQAVNAAENSDAKLASGKANLKDLSNAADVLKGRIGNSGTVDRAMTVGLLGGGGYLAGIEPVTAAMTGAGLSAMYGFRPVTKYAVGGYPLQDFMSEVTEKYASPAMGALARDVERRKRKKQ